MVRVRFSTAELEKMELQSEILILVYLLASGIWGCWFGKEQLRLMACARDERGLRRR